MRQGAGGHWVRTAVVTAGATLVLFMAAFVSYGLLGRHGDADAYLEEAVRDLQRRDKEERDAPVPAERDGNAREQGPYGAPDTPGGGEPADAPCPGCPDIDYEDGYPPYLPWPDDAG